MSIFENFKLLQSDSIFGLNAELKADPRKNKIDLLIGYYKDTHNQIPIFEAVKKAQNNILSKQKDLNYFPIDGLESYVSKLKGIAFPSIDNSHVYGAQTVGGTSALHHLGQMLAAKGIKTIAIPDPSWANHKQIFEYLGLKVIRYPYYDNKSHRLLWEHICEFLKTLEKETVILLHASCHNPSGLDFNDHQWEELAKICKAYHLFPFFDCAYQGFGTNLNQDVKSLEIFSQYLEEFFLAYSCSKNFGLYGERTGCLFYFSQNKNLLPIMAYHLKQSIRATYSNPPRNGALIVDEILSSEHLTQLWKQELSSYQKRIEQLRNSLRTQLQKHISKDCSFITEGKGLFAMTGLSDKQVKDLREKHAIYLSSDGRLNITGLNDSNLHSLIDALSNYL